MKKQLGVLTIAIVALALLCESADARARRYRGVDPRVQAVGFGVGLASTAAFFGLNNWRWKTGASNYSGLGWGGAYAATTVGCIAVSPIIATAVVRRPLTYREAHVLAGGCVVPIVGGWLVNAAYNANPHWDRY